MKKMARKLRINRETLRNLQGANLRDVAGGVTNGPLCNTDACPNTVTLCVDSCWASCTCTASTCPSAWTECCTAR